TSPPFEISGSDQAAETPWLRAKSRASSGHLGSLEIFGTITLCLVNAAAPQGALSGPIGQGVMAALKAAGTCGPAHGDSHSPFIRQTIAVTGGREHQWRYTNPPGPLTGLRRSPSSPAFASPQLTGIPPAMGSWYSVLVSIHIQPAAPRSRRY